MFTQRHYKEIAKVIRKQDVCPGTLHLIADFVQLFEHDNSKFDTTKFITEIYKKEEKVDAVL